MPYRFRERAQILSRARHDALCRPTRDKSFSANNPQGTIPESILIISFHPDIIIIEQKDATQEVALIELTIPHNSIDGMIGARERKSAKELYHQALSDLENKGFFEELYTIEIWNSQTLASYSTSLTSKGTSFLNKKRSKLNFGFSS